MLPIERLGDHGRRNQKPSLIRVVQRLPSGQVMQTSQFQMRTPHGDVITFPCLLAFLRST